MTPQEQLLEDRQELIAHTVADEVYDFLARTTATAEDGESVISVQSGALGGVLRFSYALMSPHVATADFIKALHDQVSYIVGELEKHKAGGLQ